VHLLGQRAHLLDQPLVVLEQPGLLRGYPLTVLYVGLRERLVPFGLAGLGEEDERSGVRGLRAEHEVQQDEGVGIERAERERARVQQDPEGDGDGLADQEARRPEEAREALGEPPEGVVAEGSVVRPPARLAVLGGRIGVL